MRGDRLDVLRKVRQLGSRGGVFQYRQLREGAGIDPTDQNAHARLWGCFRQLEKEGIVETVPSERKRNRYYRLKDPAKVEALLNGRTPAAGPGNGQSLSGRSPGIDRLTRIEEKVDLAVNRLDVLEGKVDKLIRMWS